MAQPPAAVRDGEYDAMSKPKVYERWRCTECGTERVQPYRTLAWTRKRGRELPCETCTGGTEPWTKHEYVADAAVSASGTGKATGG